MGYRSDVVIVISKQVQAKLLLTGKKLPEIITEYGDLTKTELADIYRISGIKWYPSYPEVTEVHDFLDSLNEEHYGLVRVGEDHGDVEIFGSPYDYEVDVETIVTYPGIQ